MPLSELLNPDRIAVLGEAVDRDGVLAHAARLLAVDAVDDADERIRRIVGQLRWKKPWFNVSAIRGAGTVEVSKAIARELSRP